MLGPVLRRIPGDVQVETSNVQVVELPSAYKLRDVKEHLNLPVLHQIQLKPVVHSFYVVTDELIYVWRVALDNQSTVADSEDQHLRRVLSTERNNRDE